MVVPMGVVVWGYRGGVGTLGIRMQNTIQAEY